jgi:chitodextrinase
MRDSAEEPETADQASAQSVRSRARALAAGATGDTAAPSKPTGLTVATSSPNSLGISWNQSSDNVGVVRYDIYSRAELVGSTTQTSYTLTGLTSATRYYIRVKAIDAAQNASAFSGTFRADTAAETAPDTTAPSTPAGLAISSPTSNSLNLSWTASTDNIGVTGYALFLNGVRVGSSTTTSYTFTGLNAGTSYSLSVSATDAKGNLSPVSAPLSGSTSSASGFAISAATVGSNTVTVTGVGFGTKAQAAPLKFENFDGRSTGALPATFGYINYGGFGGSAKVDATQSFSGGKSLRHQGNFGAVSGSVVSESFPHIAVRGFSATELYLSYRLRYNTNGGRISQLKFNRSGMEVAGANGSDCYGGKPKVYSSYYPIEPTANRYSSDKRLLGLQGGVVRYDGTLDEGWVGETLPGSVQTLTENNWVQVEEYYRLNDVGQSNGEHVTWVNGHLQFDRHNLKMRSSTAQVLNCSYLVIGVDYWINPSSTDGVTIWYDDHYLDTSRARLVLANAATWAASTISSPQPATQWSATTVVAQLSTAGFAVGSDAWLYVVRADGTVSAGWKVRLN